MKPQGKKRTKSEITDSSPDFSPAHKRLTGEHTQHTGINLIYHPVMAEGEMKMDDSWAQKLWDKMMELGNNQDQMSTSFNMLENKVTDACKTSKDACDKVNKLEETVKQLSIENSELKDRLLFAEEYSKKNNLIFLNVTEEKEESKDRLLRKICVIIGKMGLDANPFSVDNLHRLPGPKGKPRPVIVKFVRYLDREWIMSNLDKVPKPYVIKEHRSREVENNVKQLLPIRRAAKEKGLNVRMVADKLFINKQAYTVQTLHNLPEDLKPERVATRTIDNYTFFFTSANPLSNFHPSEFMVNSRKFTCAEQFIQYQKAVKFGDGKAAESIMSAKSPNVMKAIGSRVEKFSEEDWHANAPDLVRRGLEQKFRQNGHLKQFLMETEGTILVEASKSDTFWGIGKSLYDPDIMTDQSTWGQNILGKLLMDIRKSLNDEIQGLMEH